LSIHSKLFEIQHKLSAPKDIRNTFGGFNYRSNESILEAVKPILLELKCVILQTDSVVEKCGKNYIEATSTLVDVETSEKVSCSASAREPEQKKGMDDSQISGSTSSYARKYSLNGLFAIDDAKDPDSPEPHGSNNEKNEQPNKSSAPSSGKEGDDKPWLNDISKLVEYAKSEGLNGDQAVSEARKRYKVSNKIKQAIIDSL